MREALGKWKGGIGIGGSGKLIEIMEILRKSSKETSLYLNVLNTKVNTTEYIEDVTVDGKMVEVVTNVIYSLSWVLSFLTWSLSV